MEIKAIEIHASGLNDYFLLKALEGFVGLVLLGIGGSTIDEIANAVNFLNDQSNHNLILMYGFQSYPTNYADVNLSRMKKLSHLFGLPIGYADHCAFDDPNNELVSIGPAMMGFNVLEKHYTPEPGVKRIDYKSAIGKEQMLNIMRSMELALKLYGNGSLKLSKAELEYGNTGPIKKAIVARKRITKGERLALDNLWFKRTVEESTFKQSQFQQLLGLEVTEDIEKDEIIDLTKIKYEFKIMGLKEFTHIEEE